MRVVKILNQNFLFIVFDGADNNGNHDVSIVRFWLDWREKIISFVSFSFFEWNIVNLYDGC